MTDSPTAPRPDDQAPTHADYRRATALITHRASGSPDGIRFCIQEAADAGRTTPLLRCLIDAYRRVTGELRTDQALPAVGELIERWAADENADPDSRRAARAVTAHRDGDVDSFNAVLLEANDDGRQPMLMAAVLDMHSELLPELRSSYALDALAQWTARITGAEDGSAS